MKPLNIGVIGAGRNMRRRHVPEFRRIPDVCLAVVANRDPASSQRAADELGIPKIANDWRQVIDDPSVDAVVVGTWPDSHAEIALHALAAGKHVLLEARLTARADEARALVAKAAAPASPVLHVVPTGATFPFDRMVRAQLSQLGELVMIEGAFHTSEFAEELADGSLAPHWRRQRRYSGVNMLDVGKRYESMRRWLDGDIVSVAATSHGCPTTGSARQTTDADLPHTLALIGRHSTGVPVVWSFTAATRAPIVEEFRFVGSHASLTFDIRRGLAIHRPGQEPVVHAEAPSSQRREWTVERDFVRAVRGEQVQVATSLPDALAYMEFSDAVDRSMRSGTWQDVRPVATAAFPS